MAQDRTKIMAGPCRIFAGVTAGATGTPPTYITHTNGVPATGTEVGFTLGDSAFMYKATKEEIDAEQSLGNVDVYTTAEEASIECELQEHTYFALQQAFDNVGKETVAGGDAFYFGGGTGILAPTVACVMLTAMQRNAPTKFVIAVLYRAYLPNGMQTSFRKAGRSTYKVMFKALADTTRNAGDHIGYYRFEK